MNTRTERYGCGRGAVVAWASLALGLALSAATPPAERLLPPDTVAMITAPDWSQVVASREYSPVARLWADPAMRPFRDKLEAKIKETWIAPFERDTGLRLSDLGKLVQGQTTLALVSDPSDRSMRMVLLLDARDQSELLASNLAKVRDQLRESDLAVRTERLRNIEFTAVALKSRLPIGAGADFAFGQAGSLLLAGNSAGALEQILARLDGAALDSLAEQDDFRSHRGFFRDGQTFGWLRFQPFLVAVRGMAAAAAQEAEGAFLGSDPDRLFELAGLSALKNLAFSARQSREGAHWDLMMSLAGSEPAGLFSALAMVPKDASPPPFVPAEVVQFSRWRLDLKRSWAALKAVADKLSPGGLDLFVIAPLEQAARQRDPGFSFDQSLVGNLGDDLLSYSKAPEAATLDALNDQPALTLIGSPNPMRMVEAIRTVLLAGKAMLPPLAGLELEQREFQGRTIYSLPLPEMPNPDGTTSSARRFIFSASASYAAFTTDAGILEEFLRGAEAQRPLRNAQGLGDATQAVGGAAAGLFAYQNDAENARLFLGFLQNNAEVLTGLYDMSPMRAQFGDARALNDWIDLSLLPPFERIAKYFGFTVYAGDSTDNRFRLRFFTPTPPQMRP